MEPLSVDSVYKGYDTDKNFLARLISQRIFLASIIFGSPIPPGGRWMASIAGTLQGIIIKPCLPTVKLEACKFKTKKTVAIFHHTVYLLDKITPKITKKIYGLAQTHSKVSTIVCTEKKGDFFQATLSCINLYLCLLKRSLKMTGACASHFQTPSQAQTALNNGYSDKTKIQEGSNRQSYGLNGEFVPLSSDPKVMEYFNKLPKVVEKPKTPKTVMGPFLKPEETRFTIEQLAELTVEKLDERPVSGPLFRYRAVNSPILRHTDVITLDKIRGCLPITNICAERMVADLPDSKDPQDHRSMKEERENRSRTNNHNLNKGDLSSF